MRLTLAFRVARDRTPCSSIRRAKQKSIGLAGPSKLTQKQCHSDGVDALYSVGSAM